MAGTNFSIVNGADGVTKVPISTPVNDVNGNTVVGHLIMTSISGVATPIDATHPLAMTASALPLPSGAATDASLGGMATTLTRISTTLSAPPLPAGAATDATLAKISTTLSAPPLPAGAASDASLVSMASTLTRISTTLTAPPLPAGAATDATLARISTTLTTPPLPAGAATDATLGGVATTLGRISTTLSAPPLPAGAATDATLARITTALATPTLPTGAATDASLAGIATSLVKLGAIVSALQVSEAPYQGVIPMTVDQAQTAQRAIRINCTVAGNVSLVYVDGSKDTIPVAVGLSYIAGAFTTVSSAGTSATATYANMR